MLPSELLQPQVFRTDDARRAGASVRDLREAVAEGRLARLKRGWYSTNTRVPRMHPSAMKKTREDEIRARGWAMVRVTDDLLDRPKLLHARTRAALKVADGLAAPA